MLFTSDKHLSSVTTGFLRGWGVHSVALMLIRLVVISVAGSGVLVVFFLSEETVFHPAGKVLTGSRGV